MMLLCIYKAVTQQNAMDNNHAWSDQNPNTFLSHLQVQQGFNLVRNGLSWAVVIRGTCLLLKKELQ